MLRSCQCHISSCKHFSRKVVYPEIRASCLQKDKNRVMMTLVWKEKDESEAKGRCVLMKLESLELSKQFQSEISSLAKQ